MRAGMVEIRTTEKAYKDFIIRRVEKGRYHIENLNGQTLRACRSERECKNRIDTQTV